MKQLKFVEFQGSSGKWYVNCPDRIGKVENQWWFHARLRDISLVDFIKLLINTYEAEVELNGKMLHISWSAKKYGKAHQFLLDSNRIARNKKYMI